MLPDTGDWEIVSVYSDTDVPVQAAEGKLVYCPKENWKAVAVRLKHKD